MAAVRLHQLQCISFFEDNILIDEKYHLGKLMQITGLVSEFASHESKTLHSTELRERRRLSLVCYLCWIMEVPGQNIVNIRPDAVLSTNSLHQPAAGGRTAQPIPHFMASLRQKHGK